MLILRQSCYYDLNSPLREIDYSDALKVYFACISFLLLPIKRPVTRQNVNTGFYRGLSFQAKVKDAIFLCKKSLRMSIFTYKQKL